MNDLKGKDAPNEGAGVHYGLLELWSQFFSNHFLEVQAGKQTGSTVLYNYFYTLIIILFKQGYHFVSTVKLTSHRLLYRNFINITNMWHFLKVHDSKHSKLRG